MKIFMINSVCGIRSTGRICTDIADVLRAEGHDCQIAYGRETVPEKYRGVAVRIGTASGVKLHGLKARLLDGAGFGSKRATERLIKQIEEYDPDVIHLHNIHGYYIHVGVLFSYLKKAKKHVIWTLHDCWSFTGHCCYFGSCGKWQTGCYACPKKKHYPASLTDGSKRNYQKKKQLFTGVENLTIVTPSQWLADLAKQSFLGAYPVCVVHNGIDIETFQPIKNDFRQRYGLVDKKIVLGVASAWGKGKGLYDFYDLADKLGEEYQVVLVGVTEAQKNALPANIVGITRTNSAKELAVIYTAADVFVNPTYNDTYPTVNLEAQACGTPVITYRTGGSVESVRHDCIVAQGDVDGVKQKIVSGTAGIKEDLMFDKQDMLAQYMQIYLHS